MADSLSDLQTLIKTRINAHADLATLPVYTERDADLSRTVNAALATYGIAAVVADFGLTPTGATPNEYEVEWSVIVKEQVSVNDGTGSTLGVPCAEVALQIFLQLFDWQPATMWNRTRDLTLETLQVSSEVIREISGALRVVVNNN